MLFCPGYRTLRLELFKSIVEQDRTVYSIPHCDRFVYLTNHENIEIIIKQSWLFYQVLTGIEH